jgi:hypothetical protein
MKKLLYGTTALAAAGLIAGQASAAEQIKMGVGGYFQAFIVGASQDDGTGQPAANTRSHKISREGEIIFNGKTTLDNGIQFGVQVQLEAETCGDQIDESYMWVSGNFGRINIGSENSAAYLMHYAAPAPSHWAHGLNSPNHSHAAAGGGTNFLHTNPVSLSSDAEKITYFTPRLAGFQLGASYTPERCEESTGGSVGGGAGLCGGTYAGLPSERNSGQQSEIVELGANYVNKFGGVDVAVSGSWGEANAESNAAGGPVAGVKDREEWSIGGQFGFAGFTLGGAYRDDNRGLSTANSDRQDYNLGLRYATGPWGVGIEWAHADIEDAGATGKNQTDAFEVGGSYALGPGILLNGGIQYWDQQEDDAALQNANENQATIFFIGTHIAF